jgi:hypothetical protein
MNNLEMYNKFKDLSQEELDNQVVDFGRNGELETVKYLLTSPDLSRHANITNELLENVCNNDQVRVFELLLSLKKDIDIHAEEDSLFYSAFSNYAVEIIRYMVFDLNIEKTEWIKEHMSYFYEGNSAYEDIYEQTNNMFKIRDMHKKVTDELDLTDKNNDKINKKPKI